MVKDMRIKYLSGWYGEEQNERFIYRWMSREAQIKIENLSSKGERWLFFLAGHSFSSEKPNLVIKAQGKIIGEVQIDSSFSSYAFRLSENENILLTFSLNKSHQVTGDPRDLGIMISSLEVKDLSTLKKPIPLSGWYLPEKEEGSIDDLSERWIKKEASFAFPSHPNQALIMEMNASYPFTIEFPSALTFKIDQEELVEKQIAGENNRYVIVIPSGNRQIISLRVQEDASSEIKEDPRDLGLFIKKVSFFSPEEKEVILGEGWYEEEKGEFYPFHWLRREGSIFVSPDFWTKYKYLSFYAFSEFYNLTQKLKIYYNGQEGEPLPLLPQWNFYSLDLPDIARAENEESHDWHELKFSLSKVFPQRYHPDDKRELGARFSLLTGHNDHKLHQKTQEFHRNARLNYEEMMAGKTTLSSFPQNLGIDLYARCNIKPPCVYCLWTDMKKLEGKYTQVVVDDRTLLSYGPFFTGARTLVNCSFGEPLLHPRLKEILELCARFKKFMEISTNGQAFTSEIIDILVGKPIFLYVSLDAACRETYAKIRNDNWDSIIPYLIELNEKRKKHHDLPKIFMVFMPMRVNRADLEDYFKLGRQIDADAIVLRPILYLYEPKIEAHRGGYHFVYKNELLSEEEIKEVLQEARQLSKKYGIPLANQFEFGQRKEPQADEYEKSLVDFQRS
ncbi:MAG TPA: radical SAM protein [Candidatus Aminicenantes bacterium]|nr:radical SAM protein [Candidatus Aminicenantes bacterium]